MVLFVFFYQYFAPPGQCRRLSGVAGHKPDFKKQVGHRNNILILKKWIGFLHNPYKGN
jgi:hypothetical protein